MGRRFRQGVRHLTVLALVLTAMSVPRSVVTAAQSASGQGAVVDVPGEEYPPALKAAMDNREVPALKRAYSREGIPNSVTLAPVTKVSPAPASDRDKGRLQVGFSRDVPASSAASLRLAALRWNAVTGGSVTAVGIASPGAAALRLAVAFGSLPAGSEVRFFRPGDSQVFGPVTPEQIRALTLPAETGEPGVYWSPVVPGDTAAMEIFVPAGLEGDLSFTIPRVSHEYRSIEAVEKAAGSCNIDLACHSASWATTARATAKIQFISGGLSFVCTGTLLNDKDPSTFIPYFMTADHCISTQSEASTINSFWNYQRTTCGGVLGAFTTLIGGATLLSHGSSSDHSFLRLNNSAPSSAWFSGWNSGTVSPGTSMVGIHHPAGDVKKISFGVIDGISSYGNPVTGAGGYFRVHWTAGVTEGGSSGSGLIRGSFPNDRFVGTLTGGSSDCSTPTGGDWYGRFDLVYPLIRAYLSPDFWSEMDLAVYRPSTGVWWVLSSTDYTTYFSRQWGIYTDVPVPGDYDGDGKIDPAVYRPSTGEWWVLRSSTNYTTYFTQQWGIFTDVPMPGDYDGDGRMDLAVYRPSTGVWWVLRSSTNYTTYFSPQWGISTDVPMPGDYDGDGRMDPAVYRPSTGEWWVLRSSTNYTTYFSQQWGIDTDVPVPGDYDGDGRMDLAVYRPSTGEWWVLRSSTNYTTYFAKQWGIYTDEPMPGDYDGDGRMDLAVYRPSTGVWWVLRSSTNYTTYFSQQWGISTDIPLFKRQ